MSIMHRRRRIVQRHDNKIADYETLAAMNMAELRQRARIAGVQLAGDESAEDIADALLIARADMSEQAEE